MALVNLGSYTAIAQEGVDLIPLIFEDIATKTGVHISKSTLRHVSIFSEDGDLFKINDFDFEVRNGSFSTAIIGANVDNVEVESIVPLQTGEVTIYYLR